MNNPEDEATDFHRYLAAKQTLGQRLATIQGMWQFDTAQYQVAQPSPRRKMALLSRSNREFVDQHAANRLRAECAERAAELSEASKAALIRYAKQIGVYTVVDMKNLSKDQLCAMVAMKEASV